VAVVHWQVGQAPIIQSWLVDPGIPIPAEATRVHGFTDTEVAGKPPIGNVGRYIVDAMREADVLVGYNWPFDSAFLSAELGSVWEDAVKGRPIIDALVLARLADLEHPKPGTGRHQLASVARRLGVVGAGVTHRAEADAFLACRVLEKLLDHLPDDAPIAASVIHHARERQEQQYRELVAERTGAASPAGGKPRP
jgi:DNA polymerase-3 subunit epsilon